MNEYQHRTTYPNERARRGIEPLEAELRNNVSVIYYTPYLMEELISPYGDPESALIECETPTPLIDISRYAAERELEREEMLRCIAMMHPLDQYLLSAYPVRTQTDIAAELGIQQPSVSARLTRAHEWLSRVAPLRLAARGCELPWGEKSFTQSVWDLVIWQHKSQTRAARILDVTQGRVRHHLFRTIRRLPATPLGAMGRAAGSDLTRWSLPPVRIHLYPHLPDCLRCPELEYGE